MAEEKEQPARQRGDRFTDSDDPLQQLEEIEEVQRLARKRGKSHKIESTRKSAQRMMNRLKEIRSSADIKDSPKKNDQVEP